MLDPPADPSGDPGIDHGPLLAVDVVHQHHHGLACHGSGEEGQPVLDVDHDIDPAELAAQQCRHTLAVDGQLRATTDESHPVDRLVGRGGRVRRAEDRDLRAPVGETLGHLLEVALGTPALGVVGVTPAEERDVPAGDITMVRHCPQTLLPEGKVAGCRA